jgi:acyl-coenzyme A synthetase/AMP-(fatty) acid ligase
MKMPHSSSKSLRDFLSEGAPDSRLWDVDASVAFGELAQGTSLGGEISRLQGRSVLVYAPDQLTAALALIELDGLVSRLVVCPPDLSADQLAHVVATAGVDAAVTAPGGSPLLSDIPLQVTCQPAIEATAHLPSRRCTTEWVMLTSGTTGVPKMVVHTLAGLTGAIMRSAPQPTPVVWGTFYDMRRYGGLQIFLRAMLCGTSFVLSNAGETVAAHLERLGARGVTHLSGTPSQWRWALLSPTARAISPRYVRLSGEIADQSILDNLRECYPEASIAHAYASTEAGVGFEVADGREGFPASLVGNDDGAVQMKVVDGSLRIRSQRAAGHYLGEHLAPLRDAEGFVDTGDIVVRRDDRYYFVGRRGGIINVGGLKVHPEEVEAIINRHPQVRMSLVRARKNPITGAIVVADVVLRMPFDEIAHGPALKGEILAACRDNLSQHKVPAAIRFVPTLDVSASGKIARHA